MQPSQPNMQKLSRRTDLVPQDVFEVKMTKEMSLAAIACYKQEAKSRLMKLKQDLEDLKTAGVRAIELSILQAEAELKQIEEHEKRISASVDTQPIK